MPADSAPTPVRASQARKSIGTVLDTLVRDMSLEAANADRLPWDRPIFVLRSASMGRLQAFLDEVLVHTAAPQLHIMSHARDEAAIRALAPCDFTFYGYTVPGPYRIEDVAAEIVERLQSIGFGILFLLDAGTWGEKLGDAEKLLAAIGENGLVSFLGDGTYAALSDWRQRRRAECAFLRLMDWYQLKLDPGLPDGPVLPDERAVDGRLMTARVSVFLFCKNCVATIRRSVESVLAQTYQNIEYIIQDGASTDGTLEVLREYDDPRIRLRSEPDGGPAPAFWQALRRCGGDYVCACLSDEELLVDAVTGAVAALETDPSAAAVTRDAYLTDIDGRVLDTVNGRPFDLGAYMANRFCPHFSAAMFRRSALDLAGLQTREWRLDCGEFELWCRLALVGGISYLPGVASKYAQHDRQLSRTPANVSRLVQGRLRAIADFAAETGLFEGRCDLLQACRIGTVLSFADDLKCLGARREAVDLCLTVADESRRLPEPRVSGPSVDDYIRIARGQRMDADGRTALDILEVAWRLMPSEASLPWEIAQAFAADGRIDLAFEMYEAAIRLAPGLLDVHWERGVLLERRGQIDEALASWRASDLRRDARRHSLYLAAALKSPGSTNESLLALQREWANYHAPREA